MPTRVKHLSGAQIYGKFLPSLSNIRLSKGLLGRNTLAYYQHLEVMDVKSFVTLDPGRGWSLMVRLG